MRSGPRRAVSVSGVRGGTAPRQPLLGTRGVWPRRVCWLSVLSRPRQTRPERPRRLRLNASHRPLRRAHAARGSRPGLPSRTPLPTRRPPRLFSIRWRMSSAPSACSRLRRLPLDTARVRVELLFQRLHDRNAEAPVARKSTRRESPVVRRCPMLSEKARGRLDTAASGSPERPRRASSTPRLGMERDRVTGRRPCRLFFGHGNLMHMSDKLAR